MTEEFEEKVRAVQRPGFFSWKYFDQPKDVHTESGYNQYSAKDSGIQGAARVVLSYFAPRRVLDVGCAKGFVVQILRDHGIDAWGVDLSEYAIEAAPGCVRPFLRVGTVLDLEFDDDSFDLVTCLETLEHLHPDRIQQAVAELCRVTSDKLFVTIPSTGSNDFGPDGWLEGKVKPSAIDLYGDYENLRGPVPPTDLMTDKDGYPLQGHLTVATFAWWTDMFTKRGFSRRGDIEKLINEDEPLGRAGVWNVYVFEKPQQGSRQQIEDHRRAEELKNKLRKYRRLFVHSLIGNTVADQRAEGGRALSVAPEHGPGYALYGPYTGVPPGEHEVVVRLSLQRGGPKLRLLRLVSRLIRTISRRPVPGDAPVAMIDVVSGAECSVHASRVIYVSDFTHPYSYEPFSLTFLSQGQEDFQFRVYSFGREPFLLDPYTPHSCHRQFTQQRDLP
jgi:SAM-dependent methyltransferase